MISVILPTRNRCALLVAALNSLSRQTLPTTQFEVLVADNASTDKTREVVAEFSSRMPNLRYLHTESPGLHVGRHQGMQAACGEVLSFTDDDVEALPTWLESIQDAFRLPDVAMVGGNNLPLFAEPPPPWLTSLWQRPILGGGSAIPALSLLELAGERRAFSPLQVWGCNFSIRRRVLLGAGGFHPDAMPTELLRFRGDGETHVSRYVLAKRMTCLFDPGASVYHKVTPERMTFAYFWQRGYSQGISDSYTDLREPGARSSQGDQRGLLRRAAGWAKRRLLAGVRYVADETGQPLRELASGYEAGYAFHQRVYREDAEVRAWVHRPKYFEE